MRTLDVKITLRLHSNTMKMQNIAVAIVVMAACQLAAGPVCYATPQAVAMDTFGEKRQDILMVQCKVLGPQPSYSDAWRDQQGF